jgi:alkylation response protein AidB-like acyl-CoA dehydrogenase
MRFARTEEQDLLAATLRTGLARICPPSVVRAVWHDPGRIGPIWRDLAGLGLLGILAPEPAGGLGLTEVELAIAFEEAGRVAAPGPLIEAATIVVPSLLGLPPSQREVVLAALEPILDGSRVVTGGTDPSHPIPWAAEAAFCLLRSTQGPRLLPRSGYDVTPQPSVDATRRLATVRAPHWEGAFSEPSQRAALAASAMLIGLGSRMVELAVEYANTRNQFGKPIGSFQAVKHQLVDAHAAVVMARPLVARAAASIASGAADARVSVAMAKAAASDAAELAAKKALQVHGAIGYTTECDLHFFLKRTWALARSYGDAGYHRSVVAEHLLDGPTTPESA